MHEIWETESQWQAPQAAPIVPSGIHICFFVDSYEPSGVGVHLLNLMRWLDPARYQMSLICPDSEDGRRLLTRAEYLGATVYPLTVRRPDDKVACARLRELLQQGQVDIFHSQVGISWEGLLGLRIAHWAGVPVRIVTEHLPYLLTHPGQVADHRETTRLAQRVVTVSEGSRRTFLEQGYPEEQFLCIHNGIEIPHPPSTSETQAVRQALDLRPHDPLLLTVARLTEQKGHDILLAAVPAVLAEHPRACFAWVGQGPEREKLAAQAHALGVEDAVRFLGHRDDVPALIGSADLFVLPSRFEGHPLVALEALALGLPVVGTRVCGLDEAVIHGETGLLVEPEHPTELAQAILALLDDSKRRRQMGEAGRRLVRMRFDARHMAAQTMALYTTLLRK